MSGFRKREREKKYLIPGIKKADFLQENPDKLELKSFHSEQDFINMCN